MPTEIRSGDAGGRGSVLATRTPTEVAERAAEAAAAVGMTRSRWLRSLIERELEAGGPSQGNRRRVS